MFLFTIGMSAFAQEEICWDCLTEGTLYGFPGVGEPGPYWNHDFYEALSVTIIWGVIEGGGGMGYTPGGNPVPIDPEWLFHLTSYAEGRDLANQIGRLQGSLDAHGLPWVQVSDVSETLRLQGTVALVTPRDEAAAIAWIQENAEAMAVLDHPTVMFLEEGGAGLEEIVLMH